MKTISIHNLDDQIVRLIDERAKAEKRSVNMVVKTLLAQALGVRPPEADRHRGDFEEFCGVWDAREVKEFQERTGDMEHVDPEDWG
jgi:plasmid stability protein